MTSAPSPPEIVRTASKFEASIVSTAVPPVTVAIPVSAAFVPMVTELAPFAVVNFSTLSMAVKSASTIVAASALNVIVSVSAPPSMESVDSNWVLTMVMPSAPAPALTERL